MNKKAAKATELSVCLSRSKVDLLGRLRTMTVVDSSGLLPCGRFYTKGRAYSNSSEAWVLCPGI